MMRPIPTAAALASASRRADQQGADLLTTGLAIGAVGAAGALLGAVCPLCVVATPALLGLGAVQKLRARWLSARARREPFSSPKALAEQATRRPTHV